MLAELAEFDLKITNLPNKAVNISIFLKNLLVVLVPKSLDSLKQL